MTEESTETTRLVSRHLRAGWWGLLVFLLLGAVLEGLHAVKQPEVLDAGRETTRLLLRLAHAHGTLLSVINVLFALTTRARPSVASGGVSAALLASTVLLPLGFLLGGVTARGGDPGLPVILVPAGAIALAAGVGLVARRL
ncbi:MAG: hypothetical protein JST00_39610 [Deltaproteobacteria bacterium]|nr:hypothetical protein [Deltaproteobacteria bacterium]